VLLANTFSATIAANAQIPTNMLEHRLVNLPAQKPQWDKFNRQVTGEISPLVENLQTSIAAFDRSKDNIAYVLAYKGNIIAEKYSYDTDKNSQLYGYSITKSVIGTLAILAMCEKDISPSEPIGARSARLNNTLWSTATIQNVANMRSGVVSSWSSKHRVSNFVNMLERKVTPLDELIKQQQTTGRVGSFEYSGFDTNALGMFVEDQYKQKISSIFASKIWKNMPSTNDGYWQTTKNNENVSAYGLMMTGRDWVQLGRYFAHLHSTNSCFRQSLSNAIENRVRSAANGNGCAFQFWLPNGKGSQVEMLGVDGQRVFIDFEREVVLFVYSLKDNGVSKAGWRAVYSIGSN
jgi:CubicO group peptidase (beta-lactamase class C family)